MCVLRPTTTTVQYDISGPLFSDSEYIYAPAGRPDEPPGALTHLGGGWWYVSYHF